MDQYAVLTLAWDRLYVPVRNTVADFVMHPNPVQNARWQDMWFDSVTPRPTPTPVPSVTSWGMLALAAGIGVMGFILIWRARRGLQAGG